MRVETTPSAGGGAPVPGPADWTPGRRAVVIGSGFGGLAAALRLSVRGWQVQVLERLPKIGRAHV